MNFLQRIKDGAGRASERAQSAVEIGRLNSHISDIQREIEVHYQRMGQVFYESYSKRDTSPAEDEIMELCTACDLLTEEIAELRGRIADLRNEKLCECGTRLVAGTVVCPHCGRPVEPEAEEAAEDKPAEPAAAVELRKEAPPAGNRVEAEQVHDLVNDPAPLAESDVSVEDIGYADERSGSEAYEAAAYDSGADEPPASGRDGRGMYDDRDRAYVEDEAEEVYAAAAPARRDAFVPPPAPAVAAPEDAEDELFETKRFELGREEDEGRSPAVPAAFEDDDREEIEYSPSRERSARSGEETAEEREERQRRELREIRSRERRKMKEERERQMPAEAPEAKPVYEEEPVLAPVPAHDPEAERRQRERVEREKERQDELDRLIASWNRGGQEPVEEGSDERVEPIIGRRPVGEVVRCQVCGSGLPKGSKWCPHCASEQV